MKKSFIKILTLVMALCFVCALSIGCGNEDNNNDQANAPHTCNYKNNVCTICGEKQLTEGLEFKLVNNNTEYEVSGYNGTALQVEIPSKLDGKPVTSIGESAFDDCSKIASIVISDIVKIIGSYAFEDCIALTTIDFDGTIIEWDAITKGNDWNSNVPAAEVVCSDGKVSLS